MALKPEQPQRKAFDYAAAGARVYDPDAPPTDVADPTDPAPEGTDPEPSPPAFEPPAAPPEPPPLADNGPAPVVEPPPEGGPKPAPSLRFASHEEAERGYANLFSDRQRLADELRQLREGKQAEATAAYERQLAEARRDQMADFVRERSKQHHTALADLDPNDDGYDDAVADLEAGYQLDLDSFRENPPALPEDRLPPAPTPETDPPATDAPADPVADPAAFVSHELAKNGLDMADPFVRHMASGLPGVGTRLDDGRTVTLGMQMEMLVDQLATETLSRYCQQSVSPDLPGLEVSHPVLQHFVRQQPAAGEDGKPVPFYARMQQAVRDTRRWQADERRKLLAQQDAPLPQSFGPGPAGKTDAPTAPTSLGGVLDRVRENSRVR